MTIKLYDLNTLNCIKTFICREHSILGIEKLSDDTIVSCSLDETIRVWNLNSGQYLKILNKDTKITCLKVFSDKKKILSGSYKDIKVWDIETGTYFQALTGHFNWVRSIIVIASCNQNGCIQIFNINNGQCIKTIEAHLLFS